MNYKNSIQAFASRAKAICGKLILATKADAVSADVASLCADMEKALEQSEDEMFYAAVYNARATIMTAPEKCPVAQLKEALEDAADELMIIVEYFEE